MILLEGLVFPEAPRWHGDRLWFVDLYARRVANVGPGGESRTVAEFDEPPSGLGFLPDGTPLVVLRLSRRLVAIESNGPRTYADLRTIHGDYLNDMVVDRAGRAYVNSLVARLPEPPVADEATRRLRADDVGDCILLVEEGREPRVAATGDLISPNGMAIDDAGETLIVAELRARRLTKFSIEPDGRLRDRTTFASELECDGICLDRDGAVWVGSPRAGRFQRILPGGDRGQSIEVEGKWAIACVLGGRDRRTLFMATARVPALPRGGTSGNLHESHGFIETTVVDVPGAGLP